MGTRTRSSKRLTALCGVASLCLAGTTALGASLVAVPALATPATATSPATSSSPEASSPEPRSRKGEASGSVDLSALAQGRTTLSSLESTAEDKGSVRVVVTLATEFRALGDLSSGGASVQREEVRDLAGEVRSLAVAEGGATNRTYGGNIPVIALTVTPAALDALAASDSVAKIDPDTKLFATDTATNQVIGADRGQAAGYHGSGMDVAVLDTGVQYDHPAFGSRVTHAACFSTQCPNGGTSQYGGNAGVPCTFAPGDCSHGTHVAGIAAGAGSVPGVADQAQITAVQVFSPATCRNGSPGCSTAYFSDVLAGLNFVYDQRANGYASANLSLGGGQFAAACDTQYASIKTAIDNLRSVGIASVIASGNEGYTNSVATPGCISTAITVGATNNSDQVADFSNSGQMVDLYAPGVGVQSAVPVDSYASYNGTSMATPQVAGAIAVMKAANTGLSVTQIENTLGATGPQITDAKSGLSRRRLDLAQALGLGDEGGDSPISLTSDDVKDLDTPSPAGQIFETRTTHGYWSAVALRPPSSADYDLEVYDDAQRSSLLNYSEDGPGAIDFVAQDNNPGRRAYPDATYPVVKAFSGTGRYQVEYADDSQLLGNGTHTISMGSAEIIEIRDSYQVAGQATNYRLVPSNGTQDAEMYLMESSEGVASTYMPRKTQAVKSSTSGGAGGVEAFAHTSSVARYDGLVMINKSGSGDYTLYRDTTAPTGTVSINNGATETTTRNVTLSLDAYDSQTGLMGIRVSADGTFDTEAWEPYSASKSVTLPTGNGPKTVNVQFRNNAGMIADVSDSITLNAANAPTAPPGPTVTSSTPSAGAVTVAFRSNGDGGSPITSYTAICTSTDGGATKYTTGTTSPIKVLDLTGSKNYRCRVKATNAIGAGSYSAYGTTVTLPAPTAPPGPTVTTSTPSAGAVTVAFRSNGDGGSPITSYTAICTSTDGGATKYTTGTTSPIKVPNLTGSKNYRCRVKATNAIGAGSYSAYGTTVTLPAPTAPPGPTVTTSTPSVGAVTVAFRSNGDGGSPITSYTAICTSTDGGATKYTTGTTSPIKVPNLTGSKNYRCRVKATNAIGAGSYSAYGTTVLVR